MGICKTSQQKDYKFINPDPQTSKCPSHTVLLFEVYYLFDGFPLLNPLFYFFKIDWMEIFQCPYLIVEGVWEGSPSIGPL
jgi:hypothetical protein